MSPDNKVILSLILASALTISLSVMSYNARMAVESVYGCAHSKVEIEK